jgi:hypothetical protein
LLSIYDKIKMDISHIIPQPFDVIIR